MQMIANGLTTVETSVLERFIDDYCSKESVETIVVGYPKTLRNEPAKVTALINPFIKRLEKRFPEIKIETIDERFTSKMAFQTMIDSGINRKARQNKALIDQISATIILQNYMEWRRM
jgi:putative Holliday junction resolvase